LGALFLSCGLARAENEGQADLDKATEAKLNAKSLGDLDEVVRLAESALQKGLDEGNAQFAKNLLVSTLVQQGSIRAAATLRAPPGEPKLAEFRKATLDVLEKAVKLDPRQPRAWLDIARLERMTGGNVKRSDEALAQAIAMGDDDTDAKAEALIVRAELQPKLDKRLPDLDEAVRIAPNLAQAFRARAIVRADLGKLADALTDLNKALEIDPKHTPTHEIKALVLGRLKRYDEALVALDQARQLSPESVFPLMQKARIHAQQANLKAALHELDEALKLDPRNLSVLLLRATLQDDPAKKAADFDEAVRIAPRSGLAWRSRGLFFAEQNKDQQALADFDKAIEVEPKELGNYEAKSALLAKMKKYDEALAAIEKAGDLLPKSVYLLMQKARIRIQQTDYKAALAELDRAFELEPENASLLLLRAGVYQELGEKEKALADVEKAFLLEPDSGTVIRFRAMLLADLGKFDEAIESLEKLRQAEPKDMLVLLQLAAVYSTAHKTDKALELYAAILTEEPENWMAMRGRGDLYLNVGKHAEAIADFNKALKLKPKDSGILNNLAWVLATSPDAKLRDGKRAVALATDACEATDYRMPHILSTLGAAYAEVGDFQSAIKWVTKGLESANEEQKKNLNKELDSYRAGKPVRELMANGKPVELPPEKSEEKK
jgi:tetratricopeptide (TPR) repeat protein